MWPRRPMDSLLAGGSVAIRPALGDAANLDLPVQSLNVPALVFNKYSDVLAADQLARALAPDLKPGTNRLRVLFSEQAAHDYRQPMTTETTGKSTQPPLWPTCARKWEPKRRRTPAFPCQRALRRKRALQATMGAPRSTHRARRHFSHTAPSSRPIGTAGPEIPRTGPLQLEALLLHTAPGSPSAHALALLATLNDSEC